MKWTMDPSNNANGTRARYFFDSIFSRVYGYTEGSTSLLVDWMWRSDQYVHGILEPADAAACATSIATNAVKEANAAAAGRRGLVNVGRYAESHAQAAHQILQQLYSFMLPPLKVRVWLQ